jgi:hypothetical protein
MEVTESQLKFAINTLHNRLEAVRMVQHSCGKNQFDKQEKKASSLIIAINILEQCGDV